MNSYEHNFREFMQILVVQSLVPAAHRKLGTGGVNFLFIILVCINLVRAHVDTTVNMR